MCNKIPRLSSNYFSLWWEFHGADGSKWSASHSGHITFGAPYEGGWVDPRGTLPLQKTRILICVAGTKARPPISICLSYNGVQRSWLLFVAIRRQIRENWINWERFLWILDLSVVIRRAFPSIWQKWKKVNVFCTTPVSCSGVYLHESRCSRKYWSYLFI